MKNSKKLIGLATALLAIGSLAACGGGNKGSDSKAPAGSSKCSHKWVVDEEKSVAATCTKEGTKVQKCSVCGEEKTSKVSIKAHSYVEQEGGTAATCETAGTKISKCSVCGNEKTEEVEALGHDYKDDDTQAKPATCTEAGETVQHCTRCDGENKVDVAALGHDYQDDADQTGAKAATCTADGEKFQTCSRCGDKHTETVPALGHDIKLIGDDSVPEAGKAKVRVYSCANGCDTTYFGFKASEPSEESKKHLVIGEDGGAKFWGQPIGNSMVLDENGDASGADDEKIFDDQQQGDYFEYVFDLTKEQLAKMGDAQLLYCNASAANYLSGKDFWAADPSGAEWTPGYYIEGEHKGEAIADYRYILYVDDKPQEFDPTMTSPVTGPSQGQPQKEYVMPFVFKLHEGENKIRLVMAGGYKSTFYDFTFRPTEEAPVDPNPGTDPGTDPEPVVHTHTWVEGEKIAAEGKSAYTLDKCECGKYRANLNVVDLDAKITKKGGKLGSNGATARYAFNLDEARNAELWVKGTVDNANNYDYGFFTGKNGGNSAVKLDDGKTNTTFKVNGAEVPAPVDKSYKELGMTGTDEAGAATFKIGDAALLAGANELTLTRNDSFGIQYYEIFFVFEKAIAHNLTAGEKAADSALRPLTCGCAGVEGYELQAADLTEGQKAPSATNKDTRLGKNIMNDVWNITGIKAGKYALYINAQASSGNAAKGYWDSKTAVDNGDPKSNNGGDTLCELFKYTAQIDAGEAVNMGDSADNYAATGLSDSAANWTTKALCTLDVADGATSLTIHNNNNGYSIWVFGARLVRVA